MNHMRNRFLALLLALVMVVGMLPVAAFATEADTTPIATAEAVEETTVPETTAPETTVPEETVPETTVEETTVPEETVPETTAEETTVPEETVPETTVEETTVPEETVPETTIPETTVPEENLVVEEIETSDEAVASTASKYSPTIASTQKSNLAPGVTERAIVSYDSNGDRVQYFVINANIATDSTVQVKANYHDNDNTGVWGKATVVEQANAAKAKRGYNVVATTNGAYYNVSTGQPTGAFVMEGVNINGDGMGNSYCFFAIMKDGTAMIGKAGTFSQYSANVQEAVAGNKLLVWEGEMAFDPTAAGNNSKYPRSTIGIKENGDVVLMMADGNNKPYSAGLTFAEQAQVMLDLGCEYAVELDGGGSATYAAKLEGSDEVELRSVPCDGTIRSVSNSVMVISTAVADGTFDHANLSTEYAFYAPNSVVEIEAVPVDAAGGASELPEDAAWTLSDSSFGTIESGKFTSNGKLGTVTAQITSGGKVVGSLDITLVNPTDIAFSAAEKTVPYGKTADFTITAMYNGAEVYAAADAYNFEVTAGAMEGFIYTAPADETIKEDVVKATYKHAEMDPITVKVTFGKGSEILYTFETDDSDRNKWGTYFDLVEAAEKGEYTNGYTVIYESAGSSSGNKVEKGIRENVFLASREDGAPVYSGDYSLGYTLDYTQSQSHANWQYAYLYFWGDPTTWRDVDKNINGTRLGMWMYIPEEAVGSCARLAYTYKQADGTLNTAYLYFTYQYVSKGFSKLTSAQIPEAGWAYVYCDLNDISTTYASSSYYKDANGNLTRAAETNYAPAFIQFIVSSSASGAEKCTFYIDDITLDYSDVVDDRDAPLVTNPVALDDLNSYAMGSTLNFNTVSFTADAAEDTSHGTNYTGLDAATAQIYVDGQKVATSFSAGKIATTGIVLPNGVHDVTFEIADKQGNYTKLTKQITIAAETDYAKVWLDGVAPAVNKDGNLYTGAQYDLLLKTDKVEAIDQITTKIWLNSASKWALEHMSALYGFEVSYVLDELACTAEITVKRTGEVEATGEATLVTIPVYVWAWDGSAGHTATDQWNGTNGGGGCAPIVDISYDVKAGKVTYTDAYAVENGKYVAGFGSARKDVDTELNSSIANLKKTIKEWHYHTEEALADVPATCTADGYTGRTACTVCKSVLDWGTTQKATGHIYTITDGVLKCSCGDLFTGTWTDGKEYVDGVAIADGWNGDFYYKDGVKLTGIQLIDGFYYNLGEDGTSQGKYTGLFIKDGLSYYAVIGELKSGWMTVGADWYYFDTTTFAGVDGIQSAKNTGLDLNFNYEFENGKLLDGVWVETVKGTRYYYGPACYAKGFQEIDGKKYYFGEDKAMVTGITMLKIDSWSPPAVYIFSETGVYEGVMDHTGMYMYEGENYYLVNGHVETAAGMIEYEGNYYFIRGTGKAQTGSYYCNKNNGYAPDGTYEFDAEGKMLQGIVEKADGKYYYKMGQLFAAGLVELEGDYYFIRGNGKAVTGSYYCNKNNGYVPDGTYEFDAEGKMLQGIVEKTDGKYYYKMGLPYGMGMVEADGACYFFDKTGKAVTGKYYCSNNNGVLPTGSYMFNEDGTMMDGLVTTADGTYYYKKGRLVAAGMIQVDGEYYFVRGSGKVVTGNYYCNKNNGYLPDGNYLFDETGKMYNGIESIDGELYYYVNGKLVGAGMVELDGEYYYVRGTGKVMTGEYYCTNNHGIVPAGNYLFDDQGRMYNGIELIDGEMYYYEKGKLKAAGLVEIDGDYYFVRGSGKVITGNYYCNNNHGIVPDGYYLFDDEGRMYNGIIETENGKCYYKMGKLYAAGMVKVGDDFYYVRGSGMLIVNDKYYCTKNNGYMKAGMYEFDAEGKLIQ